MKRYIDYPMVQETMKEEKMTGFEFVEDFCPSRFELKEPSMNNCYVGTKNKNDCVMCWNRTEETFEDMEIEEDTEEKIENYWENRYATCSDEELDFQECEDLREELNDLVGRVAISTIKPSHYQAGGFDVIAFCQYHNLNFGRGNVVKYVTRAGKKNDELEDLYKAKEYIEREIQFLKGEN